MARERTTPKKTAAASTTNGEPGTAEHLGESPYAGEPSEQPVDERPSEELAGTTEHLGESPYAGELHDESATS